MPTVSTLKESVNELGVQVIDADDTGLGLLFPGDDPESPRPARVELVTPANGPVTVLRIDVLLPWRAGDLVTARNACQVLTSHLVVGQFAVDRDGSTHFRDSAMYASSDEISTDVLGQWLGVLSHHQQHFGDYLETACESSMSPEMFEEFVARGEADASARLT